ncbi:MAG: F0F1 ATP synthase subunit A [Anaerolineae bacterium]|nr:F0F1 ATP synthase subunit A [Anaerolineae bacterium]
MESIQPYVVFHIGAIGVTDTVVSTWLIMALIVALAVALKRWQPSLAEWGLDSLNGMISDVMGRPAGPYLPFLGTLAIFIAAANTFSAVPFITAPTRDVNTPLALAVIVFFSVHYFGIREKGAWRYLRDMATPIFNLPLEIIGQLSRTLSLTLRLFGNIIGGELVATVIFTLVPLLIPILMTGLGLFTGVLQAYVFTALASVYIASGVEVAELPDKKKQAHRLEENRGLAGQEI